ncbi:Multidrug resistance-associated protein [Ooceraea biroi]|uniref:Multidrug resistance-associated protein n=1 Tax=Ooceraea biroi TaxID=2015173 RepID=A0A026X369_OOCBI|nr:Multidrug resistance-associated protein [Ooceraea biroi]
MNKDSSGMKKNPKETANLISQLFFWAWNRELEKLKKLEYTVTKDGQKKPLKKNDRPKLYKAIFRAFWLPYSIVGIFVFIQCSILRVIQPFLQGQIINYFNMNEADRDSEQSTLLYVIYLVICTAVMVAVAHHSNLVMQQIGMRVRVACCSLIYRKMVIVGYIMWEQIGISTFVGIGLLLVIAIPIQGSFSLLSRRIRAIIAPQTDRRVQLMSELIAGIQVVKMYAWEKPFTKIVSLARKLEIQKIQFQSFVRAAYLAIIVFTERLLLYFTLLSFILLGNELTANVTYTLSVFFNLLQLVTALYFPMGLNFLAETIVSMNRLEEILLMEEVNMERPEMITESQTVLQKSNVAEPQGDKYIARNESAELTQSQENPVCVDLRRVSANWINGQLPPTLCNISMTIKPGNLCALVGPVGSGKSSVLHLLLRELNPGAGTIVFTQTLSENIAKNKLSNGYFADNPNLRISYASQEAWLFGGTVRENILFGQPYDKDRYVQVTNVCALIKDFRQFPQGDMTIVGDRGVSLSGGQRARINLARAVYRQADLYLLDDPLSAVDTHVARHLYKKCITEYLHNKTRILVTHQLQFLKQADHIVMLDRYSDVDEYVGNNLEGEEMEHGQLSSKVFKEYLLHGGGYFMLFILLMLFVISQVATSGNDYWVSYWTNMEALRRSDTNSNMPASDPRHMRNNSLLESIFTLDSDGLISTIDALKVYTFCIVSCTITTLIRSFLFMKICMNASRNLHNSMFSNLIQTRMSFFNTNPSAKSPVYSHINSTLNGLPTIRSSGDSIEKMMRNQFDVLQDYNSGAWYLVLVCQELLGFMLDLIVCVFIACLCFSFVFLAEYGNVLSADVGLGISQALILTGTLQFGIRQLAESFSLLTAVERILQYTKLPKEEIINSSDPPPPTWPSQGRLIFKNVNMKYDKDDPPVLKNLNISIEPGWKVGVVGRTGAGKSSLISALFRLFNEGMEGEIRIDGRDTSTVNLQELRSKISIIPQEPVLFSESLRYNLDPFNKYDDVMLWEVLRQVELNDVALDQPVLYGGHNFSVGQRQLICLARAILRNNRLLVLDEATANIDSTTDALIQDTIRRNFKECTVITIAHRLNTIIDSDRIIVMEGGHIVEFGTPYELLRDKPDGYFSQMVQKTGSQMAQNLLQQAEKAYRKNNDLDLSSQNSDDSNVTVTEQSAL